MAKKAASHTFRDYVLDQLEDLGGLSHRAMFGGVGLYQDGRFFAIIWRDVLYLKADNTTRADFEAEGMSAFQPYPGRSGTMQYYQVPLAVLESAHDLVAWARKSVAIAARAPWC